MSIFDLKNTRKIRYCTTLVCIVIIAFWVLLPKKSIFVQNEIEYTVCLYLLCIRTAEGYYSTSTVLAYLLERTRKCAIKKFEQKLTNHIAMYLLRYVRLIEKSMYVMLLQFNNAF